VLCDRLVHFSLDTKIDEIFRRSFLSQMKIAGTLLLAERIKESCRGRQDMQELSGPGGYRRRPGTPSVGSLARNFRDPDRRGANRIEEKRAPGRTSSPLPPSSYSYEMRFCSLLRRFFTWRLTLLGGKGGSLREPRTWEGGAPVGDAFTVGL